MPAVPLQPPAGHPQVGPTVQLRRDSQLSPGHTTHFNEPSQPSESCGRQQSISLCLSWVWVQLAVELGQGAEWAGIAGSSPAPDTNQAGSLRSGPLRAVGAAERRAGAETVLGCVCLRCWGAGGGLRFCPRNPERLLRPGAREADSGIMWVMRQMTSETPKTVAHENAPSPTGRPAEAPPGWWGQEHSR